MRKRWKPIVVLALIVIVPLVGRHIYLRYTGFPDKIIIATGPEGGRYRQVARQLEAAIESEHPGTDVVLVHTKGSMDNLEMLANDEVDFALYQPGTREKLGGQNIAVGEIAFVANAYSEKLHILVPSDSKLTSPSQLKGKRVAVGARESGDYAMSQMLLEHLAIEEDKKTGIEPHYLNYNQIDEAFRNKAIDAAFITIGNDGPILQTLMKSGRCRLLPVPHAEAMVAHNVSLSVDTIPAGLYPTGKRDPEDKNITTVSLGAQLLTRKDRKDGMVTPVARLFLDERFLRRNRLIELFQGGHEFARRKPEFAVHDGAKAVYDPELRPLLNPDFVEATEGVRSFVVSFLISAFLLFRWWHRRRTRSYEHKLDRFIRDVLEIERKQLELDETAPENGERDIDADIAQLQQLLDDVTRVRQDALSQFTAHELNEDRATDCFLEMCHALSDKINAKLTRLRLDKGFGTLADRLDPRKAKEPVGDPQS